MKERKSPPDWAVHLFQSFCNDHLSEAVLGALLHLYDRRLKTIGRRKADILFILNVLTVYTAIRHPEQIAISNIKSIYHVQELFYHRVEKHDFSENLHVN